MAERKESQRTSYLVVPHSALSPVENKQNTRGACFIFVVHIIQTPVSTVTEGF